MERRADLTAAEVELQQVRERLVAAEATLAALAVDYRMYQPAQAMPHNQLGQAYHREQITLIVALVGYASGVGDNSLETDSPA